MKRNRMSKMLASIIVLVMAMSTLVLLPSDGGTGETVKTNVIQIPVKDNNGFFVSSATVYLTNVHTGAAIKANITTPGLYRASGVPAGIYRVDVTAADQYDNHTLIVNFTAYSSLVTQTVILQSFGTKPYPYTWTVEVNSAVDSNNIIGATVGFYDCIRNETVASATTDSSGIANVSMFQTQPSQKFVLFVKASGYNSTYEEMVVAGSGSRTYNLEASKRVSGWVYNEEGTALLDNVVGYMLSEDTTLPMIVRLLQSATGGTTFEFDAFPGEFIMVIDADGGSAYVEELPISASGTYSFDFFPLDDQVQRTEQVTMSFSDDFQDFTLGVETNWSYDEAHPSLLYANIGSLRMQIDIALGNADGQLSASEINKFNATLKKCGSQYVTSSGLIQANNTMFDPDPLSYFDMNLAPGDVLSKTEVHYAYDCVYKPHVSIPADGSYYDVNLTAKYDSNEVDYGYTVYASAGYELVSNASSSLVTTMGFEIVTVEPQYYAAGGQEPVALKFEESMAPVAKAGVDTVALHSYAVFVDGNVSHYLVAVNENVTFTSVGSSDANDPLLKNLKYTWDFADGTTVETTANKTIVHMFTTVAMFKVNLTVTDAVDLVGWSDVIVYSDGLVPTPKISVKDKTPISDTITANQREVVWFNATDSVDDAIAAGDEIGVIDHCVFYWDEGNFSRVVQWTENDKNVSKAWERSGTYHVALNVTDVVGHWVNATIMTVMVNDTSAPTVTFVVVNGTWNATYIENETLRFDASTTNDTVDALEELTFSWEFADGNWTNGTGYNATTGEYAWNVTHIYNSTGDYSMSLNVSDTSGNYYVQRKLIKVLSGPRPDLWIERVYYDPLNFTEGKTGLILVNVTNKGSVNSTNLDITFYIVTADGKQKALKGTGTLYNATGVEITEIAPGEKAQYRFSYSPGSKGTFIIRVNVSCDHQLRPYSFTARDDDALHVKEAAWKQYALWGGVVAIIVLIPLLLMFRGRLAKREKKGPRRERKEKEREKASDEEL